MCNSVAVMHANVCVLFETDALTDVNSNIIIFICTEFVHQISLVKYSV